MNRAKALMRLIRLPNLLITALSMFLVQHFLLGHPTFSGHVGFIFLLSLSYTLLIEAGGFILNDIKDYPIDRINKPHKTVVSVAISPVGAQRLYRIFTVTGLFISACLSWYMSDGSASIIAATAVLSLYAYGVYAKKTFLAGNILIAFLCSLAVSQPWWLSSADSIEPAGEIYIGLYAALAFISTLFREIAKDVQDMEGDRLYGCRTVPIIWGIAKTRYALLAVAFVDLVVMFILLERQWDIGNRPFIAIFAIAVILPMAYMLYKLSLAKGPSDFAVVNHLALYHIIIGTMSMALCTVK